MANHSHTSDTTRHRSGSAANRLMGETSPYLLQHAFNPVDWHPWDAEAIERARREGKPLFVSIGYATCYWCHVMERESFEDPETAAVLNRLFVPVKVDREQRPDIDDVYMTACQVFTRMTDGRASGGWPLSVFVEPVTLKPFYVGTYFPPRSMHGRPSFRHVLESLAKAFVQRRGEVDAQAEQIANAVSAELSHAPPPQTLDASLAVDARTSLLQFHDRTNGGFGGAPKFPQPVYLELLASAASGDEASALALHRTLDAMASGGIFDQVGGGFHRYAVDAIWLVPHFEKMLYDNAQLASLYARSNDPLHHEIATRTCDYVLREMTDGDGAFFSAQDAEVAAREGGSYLWTPAEVEAACGDLAPVALKIYGLDRGTNFQDPHHSAEPPSNVLFLEGRPEQVAQRLGFDAVTFSTMRAEIDRRLLAARVQRQQPITDDKALTAWNGLMIAALAEVGMRLHRLDFVRAAARAAEAIDRRMTGDDGTLLRSSRDGRSAVPAFLEDYALLVKGRMALHRATGATEHLARAAALYDEALRLFSDPRGGCFDVRAGANELFVRPRSVSDGAMPSGNSVLLLNGLDLFAVTGDDRYRRELTRSFAGLSGVLRDAPISAALAIVAVARAADWAPEVLPRGETIDDDDVVRISVEPSEFPRVGDAASGTLVLRIADGWHVTASGSPGGIELSAGNAIVDPDMPRGDTWPDGSRVLRGTVRIPLRVRSMDRMLELSVRVQACDDSVCRAPRTFRIAIPLRD